MIDNLIEGEVDLPKKDDEFIRIDVYDGVDNTGLYLGQSSINFFHSIVPSSVTKFYQHIGEERSVASRPTADSSAIRPLLSVKYLLDPVIDNSKEFFENSENVMAGYTYLKTENGYKIYLEPDEDDVRNKREINVRQHIRMRPKGTTPKNGA